MKDYQHKLLEDIIFENRNKNYGAYYNRMTAGYDLLKALFFTVGLILITILSFSVLKPKTSTLHDPFYKEHELADIQPSVEKPEKKVEVQLTKSVAPPQKMIKSEIVQSKIPPTPTREPEVETPMQENKNLDVLLGDKNVDIEGDGSTISTNQTGNQSGNAQGIGEGTSPTPQPTPAKPDNKEYFVRDVSKMAIFPGCEKFKNDKQKAQSCFGEKLQKELSQYLDDYKEIAERQNIYQAQAKVQFVINKEGKLVNIKAVSGGDNTLSEESEKALEKIALKLIRNHKYIEPAEFSDGTKANLIFAIPIKFNSANL